MGNLVIKSLIWMVAAFGFATASQAATEKRLALVVGNGAYQHASPLANPVNDAQAIAQKLSDLGFETYVGYDLDKMGMEGLLRKFARASRESDVNLFFYAGHGMSVDGVNYLVPIDAAFEDDTALDFEAVPVDFVTRQMSVSDAVNLVFLDACRDNPLSKTLSRSMGATRSASVSNGLSEMKIHNPGKGMAIAFATSPGDVALDGDGHNSPFTSALLNHLDAENTDIAEVFTRVTGDVYRSTNQAQRPWLNVSLTGPVMLNPVTEPEPAQPLSVATDSTSTTPATTSTAMLEEQKMLFDLARETGDVEDFKAYLETFPNGLYANNARRTIRKLESEQGAGVVASARATSGGSIQVMGNGLSSSKADAIDENGPLILPVSATLRAKPSSEYSESLMDLDRTTRGNIQARLNAAGQNVGGVDGQWGGKTRRGIAGWQTVNGLQPTGYLNQSQYELLMTQTEGLYTPYSAPVRRATSTNKRRSNQNGNALGAAILGVAIGTILSK
ncbi:caspase family protein [Shimia sp. Alg240-R146]|uniref:caspase family protein n=1 Tax=Shimia sp. Alg240-R146 TaxID=2993449 RepID=UPI0022E1F6EF|nr:caspase family protein [Shimia sp. Alg240-R146]